MDTCIKHTQELSFQDIKNEHVNVCMSENRNACLHPPLKLEISHVQSSSALLYVVSATSAVHFHNLVRSVDVRYQSKI
jgi:hypothetical protein